MTGRNRLILVLLPVLALAIAFWLLALAPKRQKAVELESTVTGLQAQVDEQEQLAIAAEGAREDFPRAYRRLVVLGKAAPEDDDTSSLLVQLDRIAAGSGVKFIALNSEGGDSAAAPPPAPAPQTPADTAEQSEQQVANVESGGAASPAPPATEAQASLLPIGATIGPAGLPVMRYSLSFEGDFFRLADFVAGIDSLVRSHGDGRVGVRGRLVTIDSFDLSPAGADPATAGAVGASGGSGSDLTAEFTITTYLTPVEEGVTAGASPTGPAPVTAPTPASTTPSDSGATATASTVTP